MSRGSDGGVRQSYPISYDVRHEPGAGVTKAELEATGRGACDSIVLVSLIGHPGGPGPLSMMVLSKDGRTGEQLTPEQQFIVWTLWANGIAETLPRAAHYKRALCRMVVDSIREAMGVTKEKEEPQ